MLLVRHASAQDVDGHNLSAMPFLSILHTPMSEALKKQGVLDQYYHQLHLLHVHLKLHILVVSAHKPHQGMLTLLS